jgi:hypothetical protein
MKIKIAEIGLPAISHGKVFQNPLFDIIPDFPELCLNGGFTFRVL